MYSCTFYVHTVHMYLLYCMYTLYRFMCKCTKCPFLIVCTCFYYCLINEKHSKMDSYDVSIPKGKNKSQILTSDAALVPD